ncbi:MAG TPA: hypothetical protein VF407_04235, partial [Polyangiaceae bacterium]
MRLAPYFLLLTLTQIVCGLAAGRGRSPLGRVFAILFATLALAFPLAVPADHPAVRGILALGLAMALFRTIDLAREGRDRRERTALWRVLHVAIPFDTRRIAAAAPSFSATAFLRAVDHLAVALAAFYVAIHYGAFTSTEPVRLLVRWSGALVAAVAITEAAYGLAA